MIQAGAEIGGKIYVVSTVELYCKNCSTVIHNGANVFKMCLASMHK